MLTFPFNSLLHTDYFQLRLPSLPFREPDPSQKCSHFLSILSFKLLIFSSGCLPSLSGPLFRSTENQAAPRYAAMSGSSNNCFGRRLIQSRLAAWAASHTNSKQFGGYKVLQSTTKYYKVLRSTIEYFEVLRSTTKYYEVLRSTTEHYEVL